MQETDLPAVFLLIAVNRVDDFMDEKESKESISIIAQSADKETMEVIRLAVAQYCAHGTFLAILSTSPETEESEVDTLVVISERRN